MTHFVAPCSLLVLLGPDEHCGSQSSSMTLIQCFDETIERPKTTVSGLFQCCELATSMAAILPGSEGVG
jgi:hypothetical protein